MKLIPIYALTFLMESVSWMFRFLVPLHLVQLGASPLAVGTVMGGYAITQAISALMFGYLSDRIGRGPLIILGLLLITVSSFSIPSRTSIIELFPLYTLMALGLGSMGPSLDASVADNVKSSRVGSAFGMQTTSIHMGTSLGPAAGGFVAAWIGLVGSMYFAAFFSLIPFMLLPFVFPLLRTGRKKISTRARSLRALPINEGTVRGWIGFVTSFTLWGGVATFLPIYSREMGLDVSVIGSIFAFTGIATLLSRIPFGILLDKIRRELIMIVFGMIIAALAVSLIGYVSNPFFLTIILVAIGVSRSATNIGSHVLVAVSAGEEQRGAAMGTASASRNGGTAFGPILMGTMLGFQGYEMAFGILAVTSLVTLFSVLVVMRFRNTRQRD
ncbi:MAG: hypothetical protein CMO12_04500 [Thaumarchaeota archaeon]|nr:hypothetical protein [Nitrososphaerota archaeon]